MAFMNTQGMGASMQPVSIFKFKRGAISESHPVTDKTVSLFL